jgi:hypothetical protein
MKSLEIINKMNEKEAVKLESQKVELALIDDVKKLNAVAQKELKVYQSNQAKAKSAIAEAKSASRIYAQNLSAILKEIGIAKVKAKELGLSLPADVLAIETNSSNGITLFETTQKNLLQAEKLI